MISSLTYYLQYDKIHITIENSIDASISQKSISVIKIAIQKHPIQKRE